MRKFKAFLPWLALLALVGAASLSQTVAIRRSAARHDGWQVAQAVQGVTLKLETGIVYKVGDVVPVARATFALLDADPLPELKNLPPSKDLKGVARLAKNAAHEMVATCGQGSAEAKAVIQRHMREKITTGFDGKAELADIRPGKYWIFGAAELRSGCALWLFSVDLTKNTSLILDNNNATITEWE